MRYYQFMRHYDELYKYYYDPMKKITLQRLTTWKRSTLRLFPFGLSIYPVIGVFLLSEAPAIALTYSLFIKGYHWSLLAVLIILQIMVQITMILCTYTNPGILPQKIYQYELSAEHFAIPSKHPHSISQHKYLVVNNSLMVYQKYCQQCCIYRPIRTIHCHICNHCVQRYDHHCPWLSVCIGRFNYKYFIAYLTSLTFLTVYSTAISIYVIVQEASAKMKVTSYLLEIFIGGLSFSFFLSVFRLFAYHIVLLMKGRTTNEDMKGIYNIIDNQTPFDHVSCIDRPIFTDNSSGYYLDERTRAMSFSTQIQKGQRYSTLISERQSVLNSLIDGEEL